MANSFFKNGDKAYSENLNDGILVGNAFNWTVTVSLPTDTGAVFPNSSSVVKGKVADLSITPNSNLSIGSTISNSSGSSQVYRLTVYPAFNRFGGFKSITLTGDGTFYIANKGGTSPIVNNLDYSDLGNVPELKVLKEYDIVVTIPNNGEVTGLSFILQSSSADVSGIISQANVDGLVSDITRIDNKDSAQDGRLSSLESDVGYIVNIDLQADKYVVKYASELLITATATGVNGNAISGKQLYLYQNGVSVGTAYTNSNGVASWNVVITTSDALDFNVLDTHLSVSNVAFENKKQSISGAYTLYVNEANKRALVNVDYTNKDVGASISTHELSNWIPSEYRPTYNIIQPLTRDGKIYCYIWENGTIGVSNTTSSTYSLTCNVQIEYSYE